MKWNARPLVALTVVGVVAASCTTWLSSPSRHSEQKLRALAGGSEEKVRPDRPGDAAAYWAARTETKNGLAPSQMNRLAIEQIEANRAPAGDPLPNVRIESWGPGNFGGRLRGLVINPSNTDLMLVGSVSGGVWKSIDGGASWGVVNDFLPTLAVGSMILDPDNANRVFVGTGEGYFNVDSQQGLGILVSEDFGGSFTTLNGTANANFFYVNRLVRIPGTTKLLAATRNGIYGTDDFTVASPVWTERTGTSNLGAGDRGFVDLRFDPTTATPNGRIYAYRFTNGEGTRRVWRSTNDGATWSEIGAGEGIPTTNIRRMEIGVGTDGVVYLAVASATDATRGLWRSPAGGNAFVQTASATAFIERQGWYDLINGVKPGDSNTVLVGAVDVFKTTNGGSSITKKSFWNPGVGQYPDNYVHADVHVVTFDPTNPNTVFIGCDGGIFKSTDTGETWTELNNDLRVPQYYGIAAHPNGEGIIGGTQDNGSHLYFGDKSKWLQWFGGDGGYAAWDQQQTGFVYGATPNAGLFGSDDGGSSTAAIPVPSTAGSLFITPFVVDPENGARMMVGTNRVFFSTNVRSLGGASFSDDSSTLNGSVSALSFSPHSATTAYAGTTTGRLYRTTTLGTPSTWTQIQDASWVNSDVTSIEVDPHDGTGNTLYVTLADYGTNRVWKSVNGGTSWTAITAGLADIPSYSIQVDPVDPDRLWLGSELGLWTTVGNSTSSFAWQLFDFGPAWTRVTELVWANDEVLWLGTHGRGIYKVFRNPSVAALGAVDDSMAACDADGFLDPGETIALPVSISNEGQQAMTGVTVELDSPFAGVFVSTGPTSYGTIGIGATVTQDFQVHLSYVADCRQSVPMNVTVTDTSSGTVTHRLTLFTAANPQVGPLTEDAEDADTAFTHEATVAADDWARVTTSANSGTRSWFAANIPAHADKSLISPWVEVGAGSTTLSFALRYDLEGDPSQFWDGVLLELQVEGQDGWTDIGNLSSVPYDGTLFSNNTAQGRPAWSGTQLTWRNATVNLGTTYNGQTVRFRFRMINDSSTANVGFWVDDIAMTNVASWPACDLLGCSELFDDGFESGNTGAWSSQFP